MKFLKNIILTIITLSLVLSGCFFDSEESAQDPNSVLNIIASDSYQNLNLENKIPYSVNIRYMPDIDIISHLNRGNSDYDAILISNSMWTYMLDNVYLTESKSLAISPVVFALRMEKAKELDLIYKEITNKDVLNLISEEKIKYAMPSAVRTNAGATSYLGFINALAGNPEVLTSKHLQSPELLNNLKVLFNGVERNSGSESYTFELLDKENYDAIVASEASIISYNTSVSPDKELYMLYPVDGVPVTDSMFTFIGKASKKDLFINIRDYLLSNEGQEIFKKAHYRTWYGGVKENPGSDFKKEWGIDTSKVLKITSFPSKSVMNEAFELYINGLRKPASIAFVLDYSGSMEGSGIKQLRLATEYIFDNEKSSNEFLQFSEDDIVTIVYFHYGNIMSSKPLRGSEIKDFLDNELSQLDAAGGTPLYEATLLAGLSQKEIIDSLSSEYNYSIVLMTDGEPTGINLENFKQHWNLSDVPIYTIGFGWANFAELEELAEFTGGKAFDGSKNLLNTFREIRGYN